MTVPTLLSDLITRIRASADDPYYSCPELEWVLEYLITHYHESKDIQTLADEYVATFPQYRRWKLPCGITPS